MTCTRLTVEPLESRITPTAGDLDPTFGNAGIVRTTSGRVLQLDTVPDGRTLALAMNPTGSSDAVSIERFGSDGELDTSFGTGGVLSIPGSSTTSVFAAVPDGGAYVGWVGGTSIYAIVHITSTGTIDTTFGSGGTALVPTPVSLGIVDESHLAAIEVQSDGRIVLAGDATPDPIITGQPPRYFDLVVARITASGQLDPSFGSGGTSVIEDSTGTITSLHAGDLAIQLDGRLVIGGSGSTTPRGIRGQPYSPLAVRLTSSGQLDSGFASGGKLLIHFPAETSGAFTAASVLPDGRVLLAGDVKQTSGAHVGGAARLSANGQLDASYGTGGVAVSAPFVTGSGGVSNGTPLLDAAIDSAGRVVFATASYTTFPQGLVANDILRLSGPGTIDAGFGTGGAVTVSNLPGLNAGNASELALLSVVAHANGNILLGGTEQYTSLGTTSGLLVRLIGSNPPSGFVPSVPGTVSASGGAYGRVQVLNPTGGTYSLAGTMSVLPDFAGTVRSTTADVNGDGAADFIVGAGPGGAPEVTVYDGATGNVLASFPSFESTFTGGVFVAAADLDGDGRAEITVTPDQGGGGRVVVFSIAPGGATAMRASFFGIDDSNFRGGARAALGDVNKDGTPDLAVSAGFLGGPRTALFNGSTLFTNPTRLIGDFFAFPGSDATTLRNGVFVAAGDVDGNGFAELIFGGGPGGAPRVFILSGSMLAANDVAGAQANPVANFFVAGNSTNRGGVRLAVKDADGDAKADVVVGSGEGSPANVRIYLGQNFTTGGEPANFQDLSVFGGAVLPGGVDVG